MYAEVTKDGLFSVGEMECMVCHFSYILLILTLFLFMALIACLYDDGFCELF